MTTANDVLIAELERESVARCGLTLGELAERDRARRRAVLAWPRFVAEGAWVVAPGGRP